MANGQCLSCLDSKKLITRWLVLNLSINLISSSVSLKSNTFTFSVIRELVTDLGIGTTPISSCRIKKKRTEIANMSDCLLHSMTEMDQCDFWTRPEFVGAAHSATAMSRLPHQFTPSNRRQWMKMRRRQMTFKMRRRRIKKNLVKWAPSATRHFTSLHFSTKCCHFGRDEGTLNLSITIRTGTSIPTHVQPYSHQIGVAHKHTHTSIYVPNSGKPLGQQFYYICQQFVWQYCHTGMMVSFLPDWDDPTDNRLSEWYHVPCRTLWVSSDWFAATLRSVSCIFWGSKQIRITNEKR